jgi:aminoglycoside phosphotransferase (APT) family kinase protein
VRTDLSSHEELVARLWPALAGLPLAPQKGWDRFTYRAGDEWIVQFPRTEEAETSLLRQMDVLPELSRELSAPIPVPELTSRDPIGIAYRVLAGEPIDNEELEAATRSILPERLGRFLYDLHLVPPEIVGLRPESPERWRESYRKTITEFRERVIPLIDAEQRWRAEGMLEAFIEDDGNFRFATGIVHGDLGPEHILRSPAGDLAGVIDWGDLRVGDPAIDFAWMLYRTRELGERALAAYGGSPDSGFFDRARFYHRLGPWYEVTYGLDAERAELVMSGLQGVLDRLP